MPSIEQLRESFHQDAQRVLYLQKRFTQRVISPIEAKELTFLYHKHKQRLKESTQLQLDRIASNNFKPQIINDDFDIESKTIGKSTQKSHQEIAASRARICASIAAIRKKLRR